MKSIIFAIICALAFANAQGGLFQNKTIVLGVPDSIVSGTITLPLDTTSAFLRFTGCGGMGAPGDFMTSSATQGTVGGPGGGGGGVGQIVLTSIDPNTTISYTFNCISTYASTILFVTGGNTFSISCTTGDSASFGPTGLPGNGKTCTFSPSTAPSGVFYSVWAGGNGEGRQAASGDNGGRGSNGGISGLLKMPGTPGAGGTATTDGQPAAASTLPGTGGSGGGGRGKGTNTPSTSALGGPGQLEVWYTAEEAPAETYLHQTTISGPWTAPQSAKILLTKRGQTVTALLTSDITGTFSSASNAVTVTAIPDRFRLKGSLQRQYTLYYNNGSPVAGHVDSQSNGLFTWYPGNAAGSQFTGGLCTIFSTTWSWTIY